MIKGKIIESIRGYLLAAEPDQDSNGKVNYKRIEVACDEVFEGLINNLYTDNEKAVESNFVKNYDNQTVKRFNGKMYLDIQSPFVNLPNGKGIWFVKPRGSFYSLPRGGTAAMSLLSSLPIGNVTNNSTWKVGYVPNLDGKKIIIEHIGESLYLNTTRWDYGLVRPFSAYNDDEDVLIPNGRYDMFISQVMQLFGKRAIDNSNNNQ